MKKIFIILITLLTVNTSEALDYVLDMRTMTMGQYDVIEVRCGKKSYQVHNELRYTGGKPKVFKFDMDDHFATRVDIFDVDGEEFSVVRGRDG